MTNPFRAARKLLLRKQLKRTNAKIKAKKRHIDWVTRSMCSFCPDSLKESLTADLKKLDRKRTSLETRLGASS